MVALWGWPSRESVTDERLEGRAHEGSANRASSAHRDRGAQPLSMSSKMSDIWRRAARPGRPRHGRSVRWRYEAGRPATAAPRPWSARRGWTMALKVLYAADCEMQVTTVHKGMDDYSFSEWLDDSTWLRDALASASDIDCTHLKVYEVMPDSRRRSRRCRPMTSSSCPTSGSTVSRCCVFQPPHAIPNKRPDRQPASVRRAGGGLLQRLFSFSGYSGRAAFAGTPIEAVLPVPVSERQFDDRAE